MKTTDQLEQLYAEYDALADQLMASMLEAIEEHSKSGDVDEVCDSVFLAKRIRDKTEEIKKTCNVLNRRLEGVGCLLVISTGDTLNRTARCTASPDVKKGQKVPTRKKNPQEYGEMMSELLGCSLEEAMVAPFRPHWEDLVNEITRREREGDKPIPGLSGDYNVYTLRCRARRGWTAALSGNQQHGECDEYDDDYE